VNAANEQEVVPRPIGRPSSYDPAYCEMVVEYGIQGWSIEEIAFELGVVTKTVYNWMDAHPAFLHAMTRAKLAEMVWWERAGRTGMVADKFNNGVWSRSMAARFPDKWRETSRQEQSGINGGPIVNEHRIVKMVVVDPKDET
jgi:Putative ATPase subunit of terminase (gpP-like)